MSTGSEEVEETSKRMKIGALDLSSHRNDLNTSIHQEKDVSLSKIRFVRVLKVIPETKSIFIEGSYNGDKVVVILEKTAFDEKIAKELIESTDRFIKCNFINDIYGDYIAHPKVELNEVKTTIIHPATQKHIDKYSTKTLHLFNETPKLYEEITLPIIIKNSLSIEWIENILNHKSETDRILFEDSDPEKGFILLPDMKWNGDLSNLHISAISIRKDIKSLRDLRIEHVSLLRNILHKGKKTISSKYGIPLSQLRIFIHYQPSYYHFHVHFTALTFDTPGSKVERAHLLETVINNIELYPYYYAKATISYTLPTDGEIYLKYQEYLGSSDTVKQN